MTQYLRPSSKISVGSWTASSGTDYFDLLDETSFDDADYIQSAGAVTNDLAELGLGSATDPSLSTNHTIRFRARKSNAVGTQTLVVRLFQGATQIASYTPTLTTSFSEFTYTLSGAEADAITDYSDLRIKFDATTAASRYVYSSWLQFEVPDASGSPQTITAASATTTVAGQSLTVAPGVVTITTSSGLLTIAGQAATISLTSGLTITTQSALLTATPQTLTVVPGAKSVTMSAGSLVAAGQAMTVVTDTSNVYILPRIRTAVFFARNNIVIRSNNM